MMKKRLLSLLLSVVMVAGLYVPAANAATTLNVVSGTVQKNAAYTNGDIYANASYFDTTITSINSAATFTVTPGENTAAVSGTPKLNDGVYWCTTGWSGWSCHLSTGTYVVSYDLGGLYDITRVDVSEMNASVSDGVTTRGITGITVKAGTTKDAMSDVSLASTSILYGDSAIDGTHHGTGRSHIAAFEAKKRNVQYVDITLTVTGSADLTEAMIFGDKSPEESTLTLLNAPISNNGVFSNKYIYQNYLNSTLVSVDAGSTYSWLPNAKSDETLTANDIVSGVASTGKDNLNNGTVLWCPTGWQYDVRLTNPELTYTLRFDLKDWYDISRVDVFEINTAEDGGVITKGITDYAVAVGTRTGAMNAATISSTSTILGDSGVSTYHNKCKGTMKTITTMHGRYVDITFSTAGTVELTGVMIFGEKPAKTALKSIGGTVLTNSGIYGALDVYPQYLDATVEVLSNAATCTWNGTSTPKLLEGQVWFPPAWGHGTWMSSNNETPHKVLIDLGNTFEVTRVDVHEIAETKTNLLNYNKISAVSISVGASADSLVPVETTFSRVASWDKNATISTCAARANIAELATPTEGRYVEVSITVPSGNTACIGEINVFGNSIEKTEYSLISGNALTDADKTWYGKNHKINITPLECGTTYQWAQFGLSNKDGNNTVAVKTAALDNDYNSDGVGGEKNIADGNITSSDSQYVVPVEGKGENAVVYDFGKKMSVSRIDVHEFVKNDTGIGTITIKKGDKFGAINSTVKTVNLTQPTATELTHQLDSIELGTPVETQYLAVSFGFSDGNDATTDFTKYILGDILIFGEEVDTPTYTTLKSLSGQTWSSSNLQYYQAQGFTVEAIDTGATYTWATADECSEVTQVPSNLTGITGSAFNGVDNVGFNNNIAAATFDLKAPRTVSRVDVCYNENVWNGFKSVTVYASNSKDGLYSESNKVGVFDTSSGENKGFYPVVSGTSVIAPYTFEAVEAQYVGVVLNSTGADSDNDTTLRQIVIFGDDSKFAPLNKALNEAFAYDNYIPYDDADWANLQAAIDEGDALLVEDATDEQIAAAAKKINDAIYNLGLRGGQQLISHNSMSTNEWDVFTRWPEIKQAAFENASARLMTAEDGVTNVDPNIVGDASLAEMFDGGIRMYSGDSGKWAGWGNHGTTYILYDFGEEVWINGADAATYDYKDYTGQNTRAIGEIFVEVSNDGVNFTPAGSGAAPEFTDDEIGGIPVRFTSTTFPAKKARYAKVGVTKGTGTISYVLMEMWIRGAKDMTNKINMTDNEDGTVSADILLDTDEDGARLFLATYDRLGNLLNVEMTKQTNLTNGQGTLEVSADIADGQIAKGMVFDSADTIKPLANAEVVSKYTEAEFTLSDMFSDGGVVQRDQTIPVYGTATTGTNVTVTVNEKDYRTAADGDGKWVVYADAVDAFDTVDISATDGNTTYEAKDMLGGDVWLCSGQSNMMYTFDLLGTRDELPTNVSSYPNFRFYNVPVVASETPVTSAGGEWVNVSTLDTETIADMSAIGILAGIEFTDELEVPVGIILAARGGTSIEGFMSQDAFTGVVSKYWNNLDKSKYYNAMINTIVPYGIKGVLWYQGCQNHANTTGDDYLELEKAWVNDWRAKWNNDELPFIVTMLAPCSDGNYAHIRDKQLALRDAENDIGVISIMDLGDATTDDGNAYGWNIHPVEKKEVARRLVLTAKAVAYGDTTAKHLFPVMKSVTLKADGSVDVVFDDVYDGLKVKDGDTTVTGFKLKVGDNLVSAVGTITGTDTVNVKVDGVLAPTAVWYAYQGAINPELNLFNSEDLSAAPFYAELN